MTPIARLWVQTVTTTVVTMTAVSLLGSRLSVLGATLCQLKVATETMIMTATKAAIGIIPTRSPNPTTRMRRKRPARKVEIRVRAPEALTLIMVCPTMAQPPIPPKKPESMLATPWAHASRVFREWVSVTSSTSFAVRRDSNNPTTAMAAAKGAMMVKVSQVQGTFGIKSSGKLSGRSPSSPTVGTTSALTTTMEVNTTMATRGAGIALVIIGMKTMMASPAATSG